METIALKEALRLSIINTHTTPVITESEITKMLYQLYKEKTYKGIKIGKISKNEPDPLVIRNNLEDLISLGVIQQIKSIPVYCLTSHASPSAQQVACSANPFSHVAYLNAMEVHGITDRIPKTLQMITCSANKFIELANAQVNRQFPEVFQKAPIIPKRIIDLPNIDGKKIRFHQKKNFELPKEKQGANGIRVPAIGDTFLSMLQKPELCGGFDHVLEVFEAYAKEYLPLIIRSIDKSGTSMDKARGGYILEELLGLSHRSIEQWKKGVKRGGSRKLIASKPYINRFSETWCISLNNQ